MNNRQKKQYRAPDYRVRALRKSDGVSAEIGTAYKEDNGRVRLWFNPFVTVPTGPDYVLFLFVEGSFPDRAGPTAELPEAGAGRFEGLDFEG